jgi:hypothetical protein
MNAFGADFSHAAAAPNKAMDAMYRVGDELM